jgi:hypothetical protein
MAICNYFPSPKRVITAQLGKGCQGGTIQPLREYQGHDGGMCGPNWEYTVIEPVHQIGSTPNLYTARDWSEVHEKEHEYEKPH